MIAALYKVAKSQSSLDQNEWHEIAQAVFPYGHSFSSWRDSNLVGGEDQEMGEVTILLQLQIGAFWGHYTLANDLRKLSINGFKEARHLPNDKIENTRWVNVLNPISEYEDLIL